MEKLNAKIFYEKCYIFLKQDNLNDNSTAFLRKRRSIIEKFESELESYGVELAVHGTYEYAGIKDMRADAITQFHIRIEVRHEEHSSI